MKIESYFDPVIADDIISLAALYQATKWWKIRSRLAIAHVLAFKIRQSAKVRYIKETVHD